MVMVMRKFRKKIFSTQTLHKHKHKHESALILRASDLDLDADLCLYRTPPYTDIGQENFLQTGTHWHT